MAVAWNKMAQDKQIGRRIVLLLDNRTTQPCAIASFPRRYGLLKSLAGAVLLSSAPFVISPVSAQPPGEAAPDESLLPPRDWARELDMKIFGPFTLAAGGDIIAGRAAYDWENPGFQGVVRHIRNADVAAANFEGNIRDIRKFKGAVTSFNSSKDIAPAMRAIGFDMFGRANNHALDAGVAGLTETDDLLEDAGIVTAGSGRNLEEARRARFIETPKGRIGLLAVHVPQNNEYGPHHLFATHNVGVFGGKAGVNPLRVARSVVVTEQQIAMLRTVRDSLYELRSNYSRPVADPKEAPGELRIFGTRYVTGPNPGDNSYVMNGDDLRENLVAIRNGKQYSHFMMVMIHAHQNDSDLQIQTLSDRPPDFLVEFARKSIDAGADAFLGSGPHTLRGIEIYKGKPIFYGLGELFQDLYTLNQPSDEREGLTNAEAAVKEVDAFLGHGLKEAFSTEAVLAVSSYENGTLKEIRLYPTDNPKSEYIVNSGVPHLADQAQAREILQRLQRLSEPFGTDIKIEGNIGIIRVDF